MTETEKNFFAMRSDRQMWQLMQFLGPASDAAVVAPSDTTAVSFRSLYIGGAGDVTVVTSAGVTVDFVAVPAGSILPVSVIKVKLTGTTATNIVGLI
jgi:hypothetical protein